MKLITKELREKLPPFYSQEDNPDPEVHIKFFCPWNSWTWYGIEFDGDDTFFGWVDGDFPELGYFTLSELESVTGPMGLKIERDLYFESKLLSEVQK